MYACMYEYTHSTVIYVNVELSPVAFSLYVHVCDTLMYPEHKSYFSWHFKFIEHYKRKFGKDKNQLHEIHHHIFCFVFESEIH